LFGQIIQFKAPFRIETVTKAHDVPVLITESFCNAFTHVPENLGIYPHEKGFVNDPGIVNGENDIQAVPASQGKAPWFNTPY
jgi:hypothetical protein